MYTTRQAIFLFENYFNLQPLMQLRMAQIMLYPLLIDIQVINIILLDINDLNNKKTYS